MYALLAFGAVGVTLVIASLIGYAVYQRTQWDVRWGRYRDARMTVADETLVKIVRKMNEYREIDHPLHSALMPVIEEHNERTKRIKEPSRHRI